MPQKALYIKGFRPWYPGSSLRLSALHFHFCTRPQKKTLRGFSSILLVLLYFIISLYIIFP